MQAQKEKRQITNCIVIDDEQNIVSLICDLLGMINVEVIAKGSNGKEAFELYKKHHPDIVFTDLSMPDYDGLYAVEKIKYENPNAKIIVITGNAIEEEKYFLDLLNVPLVTKPFDMNKLAQVIEKTTLTDMLPSKPFEIKYKFKNEYDFYTCVVNYEQYRNFTKLPIIDELEIVKNNQKEIKMEEDEIQNALDLAMKKDSSRIRKLSKITTRGN